MKALVDTNVIARMVQTKHPAHQAAITGIQRLHDMKCKLYLATQSLFELYVVATRPQANNGLGIAPATALLEIQRLESLFSVIPETSQTYPQWFNLMSRYNVVGKAAHDGRLVATMISNEIRLMITFNTSDFLRYTEITVHTPEDILADRIEAP